MKTWYVRMQNGEYSAERADTKCWKIHRMSEQTLFLSVAADCERDAIAFAAAVHAAAIGALPAPHKYTFDSISFALGMAQRFNIGVYRNKDVLILPRSMPWTQEEDDWAAFAARGPALSAPMAVFRAETTCTAEEWSTLLAWVPELPPPPPRAAIAVGDPPPPPPRLTPRFA